MLAVSHPLAVTHGWVYWTTVPYERVLVQRSWDGFFPVCALKFLLFEQHLAISVVQRQTYLSYFGTCTSLLIWKPPCWLSLHTPHRVAGQLSDKSLHSINAVIVLWTRYGGARQSGSLSALFPCPSFNLLHDAKLWWCKLLCTGQLPSGPH